MKNETGSNKAADLRRRAQDRAADTAAQTAESLEALPPGEIKGLLHELRVHQIELEMQNEELRQAQAELEASRARYFDLYDLAPVGYFTLSEKGLILEANLTAAGLLGVTRSALATQPLTRFISPEDQDIYYGHRKQLFETGAPHVCELRMLRGDGAWFWARLDATTAHDAGGAPICRLALSDITDYKRAEAEKKMLLEQLLQSQKMESIGMLAGGMAHDFNNMLTVILGNAQLAAIDIPPGAPERPALDEIINAAIRSRDLTMKLLTFARKEKLNVKDISMNSLLGDLASMLERSIPKSVDVRTSFMENLPPVRVDANQIQQVLLNICTNACDAMPGGGTLTIQSADIVIDDDAARQDLDAQPGHYCLVQIRDTGIGMIDATQERIFDPFYTTKGSGKGTGLGLSIAYGIVKNHGGFIQVSTESGKGACFKIHLPFSHDASEPAQAQPSTETLQSGVETILVVDDESSVLEVAGRLLRTAGYTVLLAEGGDTALRLYRERRDRIALVVLDMIMPGMDGRDVYIALKKINPDVRVVLSSGYSADGQAGEMMAAGVQGFIQKPYSIVDLCHTVRRVLDGD